jgi:hypothetical protein
LDWTGVTARRMSRHFLAAPSDGSCAEVAGAVCGVHAQVLSAAELSLARRVAGATRVDVQRALWEERSLVKTFGPRGTVHLLPTAELPMWTGALSALPSSVPLHPPGVRFTAEEAEVVLAAIGDALAGDELTVDELTAALGERVGAWAVERTMDAFQTKWPRWRVLTSTAGHRGVLCFGPNRGRQVTYTNPHRWLPGFRPAADAVHALVARYLHAYGPATPQHFAKWLGIPPRAALGLFEGFEEVRLEGEPAWVVPGDTSVPPPSRGVRLLPYFDAYLIGAHPRALLYPGPAATRALSPSGQAGNYPVLLIDGLVAGVWHTRRTGRKLAITVEPLGDLTAAQRRELDDEVELVGTILEATPTLTIGKVTAGPHA